MGLKRALKKLIPGVVWQNPLVGIALKLADPFDSIMRAFRGLGHLPKYSHRIRSNGFSQQFGGANFHKYGQLLAKLLVDNAGVHRQSMVLEIGCGCGRTAHALANVLDDGRYVGMDIEKVSLDACVGNAKLVSKEFRFDHLDIENKEYNPGGQFVAATYKFPYADGSYDSIFLISVFTHMISADVRHYIEEISRLLKPGGTCLISTFLMDHGKSTNGLCFPYEEDAHHFNDRSMPEVAVGYYREFFVAEFARHNMAEKQEPLWGSWRNIPGVTSKTSFAQDIIVFTKPE